MAFYKPKVCQECGHKEYPLKNSEGIIWQNLLKVDWLMLIITLSIILMILGFKQTLAECKNLITDPCAKFNAICCVPEITDSVPTPINIPSLVLNTS